jgi:hypothetical protein
MNSIHVVWGITVYIMQNQNPIGLLLLCFVIHYHHYVCFCSVKRQTSVLTTFLSSHLRLFGLLLPDTYQVAEGGLQLRTGDEFVLCLLVSLKVRTAVRTKMPAEQCLVE